MDDYISRKLKVLSFLSVILVVITHGYNLKDRFLLPQTRVLEPLSVATFIEYFVSGGLARFSVPFFFAASGYLFFYDLRPTARGFGDKLRRRLRSLALPYLLWNALGVGLVLATQDQPLLNPSGFHWVRLLDGGPWARELIGALVRPIAFQLWFMRDLMVCVLLSPLLYWLIARFSFWVLVPLAIPWLLQLPLTILEPESILFFVGGGILAVHRVDLRPRVTGVAGRWIAWLLPLDLALITVKTLLAHGPSPNPALLLALHRAVILCGLFWAWYAYDGFGERLHQSRLVQLAAFTFFIYAAHEPLLIIFSDFCLVVLGTAPATLLAVYLGAPAVIFGLCLLLGMALRRWARPVFLTLTGGRG